MKPQRGGLIQPRATPSLFYTSRSMGHENAENIFRDDRLSLSQPGCQYRRGTATDPTGRCVEQRGQRPGYGWNNKNRSPERAE